MQIDTDEMSAALTGLIEALPGHVRHEVKVEGRVNANESSVRFIAVAGGLSVATGLGYTPQEAVQDCVREASDKEAYEQFKQQRREDRVSMGVREAEAENQG